MTGIHLRFDRLTDGTLVAVHQGVAAIVFPLPPGVWEVGGGVYRWALAGDVNDVGERPHGEHWSGGIACAEAAEALGVHLGVTVDGYEIAP